MPSLVDALETEMAKLGLGAQQFTIRMTGCPNGCARPYTSDIGLVGQTVGKYKIFVGGNLLGTRLNFTYKELIPLEEIVQELVPLLVYYTRDHTLGESLGDFCQRRGREDLLHFDSYYKEFPREPRIRLMPAWVERKGHRNRCQR